MIVASLVVGLMVAGLLLIAIEVLVIPGFGVVGALGIGGVIGSGYLAYSQLDPTYAAITVAAGLVGGGVMFWLLPKTKLGKSMVLETQTLGTSARPELKLLIDQQGVAVTPLRPSGSVEIDDRPVDVVTDGEYIEAGTAVRVVRVEGGRVVVERLSDESGE